MRTSPALLLAVLAVAVATWLRIHTAFATGAFDDSPEGLLRADPGTLWYLLGRFIAGGGWPDASFAADPHLEHPTPIDCWAEFTIGHEFLLTALHALCPGVPLHRLCVIVMAAVMSLSGLGVFAATLVLTRAPGWAAFATALFAATPAGYRTIGFVLMNEDLSLPLYTLHLALVARALTTQRARDALGAGLALIACAATWHASAFLLALGAAVACGFVLCTGKTLLPRRATLTLLGSIVVGGVLVPVLRAKGFAFGPCAQLLVAAASAAGVARWPLRLGRAALGLGAVAGVGLAEAAVTGRPRGELTHVLELMWAKLRWLGEFPADPGQLSFDARIMWQGPFASMSLAELGAALGVLLPVAAVLGVAGLWRWRGGGDHQSAMHLINPSLGLGVVLALLVQRLQVWPALLAPIAVATWLSARSRTPARAFAGAMLLAQVGLAASFFAHHSSWHQPVDVFEARGAIAAVRELTPNDAAIAADPVTSGAILAHTGRRVVVQSKWERRATRTQLEKLLTAFHKGTPAELHRVLRDELRAEWFLVDRNLLWARCRLMSGVTTVMPEPGCAAFPFCADDLATLRSIKGFQLVYRSPSFIVGADGQPSDRVRLYRVLPERR